MVRVISVHHFDSQAIQTCEDPVAVTTAPPDRLLVALSHHVVEVRDLSDEGKPAFSFPTVDQVCFMLHCATGNYIATLETKVSRQGRETIYTRIYANWERNNDTQSMRARIAGRVTPSSSQTGGDVLEMIELPVKFHTTTAMACCQATGNLLVSCQTALCLFQLVSRTHDISRLKFLDFELWPVTLELSFSPLYLAMVEDVVAAMDNQSLHVFRINKGVTRASDWSDKSSSSGSPSLTQNSYKKTLEKKETNIDIKTIGGTIDIDALINDVNSPTKVLMPSIEATKNVHHNLPFKPIIPGTMGVAVKEMPTNEPWAEQMTTMVESLLQLQVVNEEMHCLVLRSLYTNSSSHSNSQSECPRLRSPSYSHLVAFNCVIATHQEAYLYHFPVENGDTVGLGHCISVYSFTSPVSHICLEQYLLHALTNTGLETYTMRSAHAVYGKLEPVTTEDPICLVGLRPFIGAVDLLISPSHLIVLSSSDDFSNWTVYSLQLPSYETLIEDMISVASIHQFSVSCTYRHLICEVHAILYTVNFLSTSPLATKKPECPAYKASCRRLADYFLSSNNESDWKLGFLLCDEVEDTPVSIYTRLQTLQEEAKKCNVHIDIGPGLAHYIQHCLENVPHHQPLWLPPAALECLPSPLLAGLLLQSQRLRESTTERHIETLCKNLQISTNPTECIATIILYIERGKSKEAETILNKMSENSPDVMDCLLQNWTLLVDDMRQVGSDNEKNRLLTFSDFGILLMMIKPLLLAKILAALVAKKHEMDLQQVLQVFLAYLPSRTGVAGTAASSVLQGFLEQVFVHESQPNVSHPPTREALQILMRCYLSDLRINPKGIAGGQNPFPTKRPLFLHLLPPFAIPEHISLIKLEWLICNNWLDTDCLTELTQYVNEVLPGCLSLKILAQPNGFTLLIDKCPVAVLQYLKEMLKNESQLKPFLLYLEEVTEKDTKGIYAPIFNDVLEHLTESLSPEELWRVLPGNNEKRTKYKTHLATCQQLAHANHIRSIIIATSKKLITTLNL
uniref:BLOC-2 complex member HPS3 N-terminal domain-containing protein n=1 Tax=Clastoptera arizonana TaxID=38151 RepID=A0A1B6CI50_9HEMI